METRSTIPHPTTPLPSLPASRLGDAQAGLERWRESALTQPDPALAHWMAQDALSLEILAFIMAHSPYLSRLLIQFPKVLYAFVTHGAESTYKDIISALPAHTEAHDVLMRALRQAKAQTALLVAIADLTEHWTLEQVTAALTHLAEECLALSINALLHEAHVKDQITLPDPASPSQGCGLIVLGMGKLGGTELNYSSDIDLILLFEPGTLHYRGRQTEQHFMNRLAHNLVTFMQERTADGYVFRTDLRLRPDPASTPPVVTITAAYYYYESVGQNWERAAMIKARPVAGDIEAGNAFLKGIGPFMWRRNLDFAAIDDIHSIKRQMDSRQRKTLSIKGHNIKIGVGGIREIEFYTQIHQLIWGGREPLLRLRGTCETLGALVAMGQIPQETRATLHNAYIFLRKLEHRLQMVADEQTHTMPDTDDGIALIASFMGFNDTTVFVESLNHILDHVHSIYAASFTGSSKAKELGSSGNLVFTGTNHDPDTLTTLRGMGYATPETVSEVIMGWHHGSRRATRTKRARELLTELMPRLLESLALTANPDDAFLKFDDFLNHLPAGVQLFSLFHANPYLLELMATLMGNAPMLAATLSKSPELLDIVLYGDFYEAMDKDALPAQLEVLFIDLDAQHPAYFEEAMRRLQQFRSEKHFQVGVQLLKWVIGCKEAGAYLSALADAIVAKTLALVTQEFAQTYGTIPGCQFAIIGLGKLGSREMTFRSDLDLVFIYDAPDFDALSDGEKSFSASVYYNRLAQRFINALTASGKHGKLYDVDTRLRPSGAQGLLAVSTQALTHYFAELAWTFEFMAFTKARVITAEPALEHWLNQFIVAQLTSPRDPQKLRTDAASMRERIAAGHDSSHPWDMKYARGGLIDLDFIAQYLLLLHAPATEGARAGSARDILEWVGQHQLLPAGTLSDLLEAEKFLNNIFHIVRLCASGQLDEHSAPPGLKKLLIDTLKQPDFATLTTQLIQVEKMVHAHYIALLET